MTSPSCLGSFGGGPRSLWMHETNLQHPVKKRLFVICLRRAARRGGTRYGRGA